MTPGTPPGARFALRVIHPGPPALRMRYRQGVLVAPSGAPDWLLYARAVVRWPHPPPGCTADELRVAQVLAANLLAGRDGDPLWADTGDTVETARTPAGWTWALLADGRHSALVPIELHAAYRHFGGVTTTLAGLPRGLRTDPAADPVEPVPQGRVAADALDELGRHFGYQLPAGYRAFLAATNGAAPLAPGLHDGHGFVLDQPLFGLARTDRTAELWYANAALRDRLTRDYLAIGYVQGGLLAVRTRDPGADSIWYLDDDDPRARDDDTPERICAELLARVADDIESCWRALRVPGARHRELAHALIAPGAGTVTRPQFAGCGLPGKLRASWQSTSEPRGDDPLLDPFQLR